MTKITLGTCLSLTATQSCVLKVYGAISGSRLRSGSPVIWGPPTAPTMPRTAYTCSLHGLPVMMLTTARGRQPSTYGGESHNKERGAYIMSAARTDLSLILNSLGAIFPSCFIPASHLRKSLSW